MHIMENSLESIPKGIKAEIVNPLEGITVYERKEIKNWIRETESRGIKIPRDITFGNLIMAVGCLRNLLHHLPEGIGDETKFREVLRALKENE
jgi:hypothetical protein